MLRRLVAAIAVLCMPMGAAALEGATCGYYFLKSNPDVWIEDKGDRIVLFDGAKKREYEVTIVKLWGVLTSAAIESRDKDAHVHYFAKHGDKLIFDSIAFEPEVCELPD